MLTDSHAYKLARVRPLKCILKLIAIVVIPAHYYALHEKYDYRTSVALWKYLWAGWYANRAEARLWYSTQNQHFMPVTAQLYWGFVIVQPRACPVTIPDIRRSDLSLWHAKGGEFESVHQYGLYAGSVRLVDYAHLGMQDNWPRA